MSLRLVGIFVCIAAVFTCPVLCHGETLGRDESVPAPCSGDEQPCSDHPCLCMGATPSTTGARDTLPTQLTPVMLPCDAQLPLISVAWSAPTEDTPAFGERGLSAVSLPLLI